MNVSLTPELERFIGEQVKSGRYRSDGVGLSLPHQRRPRSASEVVRDAVRLLEDRVAQRHAKLEALRNAVEVGLTELDAGGGLQADVVFKDLLDRLNQTEAA